MVCASRLDEMSDVVVGGGGGRGGRVDIESGRSGGRMRSSSGSFGHLYGGTMIIVLVVVTGSDRR